MYKATLYRQSNGLQRRDAKQVLEDYGHMIQWCDNGKDSLLDIGCGTGDVIVDFLYPMMPARFTRLIGADISDAMVRFARESINIPNVSFVQMNIESDLSQTATDIEPFNHITSFYCLHWVQNQKKAFQNIFNLLQPNGDCLLVFLAKNPVFEAYKVMAATEKWAEYMPNVNDYVSPYQYSNNPTEDVDELLSETGFTYHYVTTQHKVFTYESVEILKNALSAVNPFLSKMSSNVRKEYLDDYVEVVRQFQLETVNGFETPYQLIIAYARK